MLEGKSCLVTGGGSGIGRATAIAMARAGAKVTVADLPGPAAGETAAIIQAAGGTAQAVVVFLCMKHELAAMEATGGGAIVNTASIAGLVGLPHSHAYVAAKHGVVGLTKAAAIDHAAAGIRVNAVCPGYVETPMIGDSMARRGERILARPPMHRLGTADEIADAVVWLCSDQARFVTGTTLAVDGGYTAG